MIANGRIMAYDGELLTVGVPFYDTDFIMRKNVNNVQVVIEDGRRISADQRKKLYATFNDISEYTGYVPEYVKEFMKYDFIAATGCEHFSLSNVDMSTAKEFLEHTIEFCVEWGIPTKDSLLERTPDIARYVYKCAIKKKCCFCGKKAVLHHLDAVGMGRNRKDIIHIGMEVIPLSIVHHKEAHTIGKKSFCEKYHVCGVMADEEICKVYNLKRGEKV